MVRPMKNQRRYSEGFSLVEIAVVMIIMGVILELLFQFTRG